MFHLPIKLNSIFEKFSGETQAREIRRLYAHNNVTDKESINEFIDLIVFTCPGEYVYDYDFGFCFWNDVYNNISIENFNISEYPRKKYTDDLIRVINKYEPRLENVKAEMVISYNNFRIDGISVKITVQLTIYGTIKSIKATPYHRNIIFSIGPTIKKPTV